jgi:nitroreductase
MVGIVTAVGFAIAAEQASTDVQLPKPQMDGGKPLMQALKDRHSTRTFSADKLPPQVLSNLLWAAFGVNRPEAGERTAPSAMNKQEIDIYVASADGLFLYDAKAQSLKAVLPDDVRAMTGGQDFVATAPINLVYVADLAKMGNGSEADKSFYSAADTGFIAENVYLFCASEGLATVVRGSVDRDALAKRIGLRPDQKITLAQTVGYPKK